MVACRREAGEGDKARVTSPLTGAEMSLVSAALGKPWRGRTQPSGPRPVSLLWARVRRGASRQTSVLVLATILMSGVALLYEFSGGAPLLRALPTSLAIGVGLAVVMSVILELSRNTVTSLASLGKRAGYMVLGAAPELTPQALRELPPETRSPLGCLALQPGSQFASAFRDLQSSIGKDRMVAFVGSVPNEGASTAALAAAVCAHQQGRRVLLVDCDLRRRSLTRTLVGEVEAGVLEAANRPQGWRDLLHREAETGLHFMPAAKLKNPWNTLMGVQGFASLLDEMRGGYELIVLDCPPLLGSAEGTLLARMADGCVVGTAWDDTPVGALREGMRGLRDRPKGTTGVYVNRVPPGYRFGRLRPD